MQATIGAMAAAATLPREDTAMTTPPRRGPLLAQRLLVAALVAVLPLTASAYANERYDAWQAERPYTLGAWASHNYGGGGTLDVEYFRASGLNTAMDNRCSYGSSREMVDVGGLPLIYQVYADNRPDLPGFIADFEKARKHHRNIVALLLGDEVRSVYGDDGLTHMRQIRDWVANHPDPEVRRLLLLTCTPGGGKMASSHAIREYMNDTVEQMRPDGVISQIYELGRDHVSPEFYASLEWYAKWCRQRDVSMWVVGRTWASARHGVPSESVLRLQKFVNLAYGVRGMVDFIWRAGAPPTVRDAGYWNFDGKDNPTPLYRDVAPVNREVTHLAKAIVRLHPVRAYHMDSADDGGPDSTGVRHWSDSDADLPASLRRSRRLANVTGAHNANHLLVAFFRDDAGEEYFMVVNKDVADAAGAPGFACTTPVMLNFHPSVATLQRLRRDDGELDTIPVRDHYTFNLPGGTGDLFRFSGPIAVGEAFAGFATVRPPRLLRSSPSNGGTVGRLARSFLRFTFDADARNVHAQIRRLDADGKPTDADLADRLQRSLGADRTTLVYRDTKGVLLSGATYQVDLHWTDAQPLRFSVMRGDVDGDGALTAADTERVRAALDTAGAFLREDLNGDGAVDDADLLMARRTVEPLTFVWEEDFESYPQGNLTGRGDWLAVDAFPGTLVNRLNAPGDAVIATSEGLVIAGAKSAIGPLPGTRNGNAKRFLTGEGAGGVGHLIVDFVGRIHGGHESYHIITVFLFNGEDADGTQGGFQFEIDLGPAVFLQLTRGIRLGEGTKKVGIPSAVGLSDIAVHVDVDFTAGNVTWSCRDLTHDQLYGPFVTPFTGTATGIDAVAINVRGPHAAIDDLRIEGR